MSCQPRASLLLAQSRVGRHGARTGEGVPRDKGLRHVERRQPPQRPHLILQRVHSFAMLRMGRGVWDARALCIMPAYRAAFARLCATGTFDACERNRDNEAGCSRARTWLCIAACHDSTERSPADGPNTMRSKHLCWPPYAQTRARHTAPCIAARARPSLNVSHETDSAGRAASAP